MPGLTPAHLDHRRNWRGFDYCYPVISRRSKGLSLGVNLNQNKVCNFNCVYCEVDRNSPPKQQKINLDQLEDEMELLIEMATSNKIFDDPPFFHTKIEHRRLNDIAFSGDGEPTAAAEFPKAAERLAGLKKKHGLADVKLVLITNATRLQEDYVINGIDTMMANNGEIWAKLDAGTEAYCQAINRSNISLDQIIKNLEFAGKRWPIIIQTLFLEWATLPPSGQEIKCYINKLKYLLKNGITLQGIQLHTVARPTPEMGAKPLPNATLDNMANIITKELPNIFVDVFYGPTA
jgi:wyosine [tRNA(Phe)-imidazoG37] synthetase (radical SAM superfamily)